MTAYDIPETQVLLYFDGDPGHSWHHRVLLVPLGNAGRWVATSTDWETEVLDLMDHVVIPLSRNTVFPARVADDHYTRPLSNRALDRVRAEARALAAAMGVAPPAATGADAAMWVLSDPAHEKFGEEVDERLTFDPARALYRGSVGLIKIDDEWTVMERVLRTDVVDWKAEKAAGPGRDARVLPISREGQKTRFRTVREALRDVTPLTDPPAKDWPFRGPSATMELLTAVRAVSDDFAQFHEYFIRTSGLASEHAAAIKHKDLLGVLMHLTCFDQLNVTQLAGAEACSRYILQIHAAVKRNPKAPDFKGLGVMTASYLDATGGILTGGFAKFVAEEQKNEAFTLKQQRLYAEEAAKRQTGKP